MRKVAVDQAVGLTSGARYHKDNTGEEGSIVPLSGDMSLLPKT